MNTSTKSLIHLLIELLDQLTIHTENHSDLFQVNRQQWEEVKDELFRLTLEKQSSEVNDPEDLRSQLLTLLPQYLNDPKKFPKKEDLLRFAQCLQIPRLKKLGNKTRFDLIGNILVEIATRPESELIEIAQSLSLATRKTNAIQANSSTSTSTQTPKIKNWFDFYQSLKR